MSWEVVKLKGSLGEYDNDWWRLNDELYHSHPLFDVRCINLLLEFYSNGEERLCIHRDVNGEVDGLLIVVKRKFGIWSLFLPSQLQIAPVLVKNTTDLRSLFKCLPKYCFILEFLNQDPLYSVVSHDTDHLPIIKQYNVTTISIDVTGDFESYWQRRSRKLRQNVNRYINRIKREGRELSFVPIIESENENLVSAYGELESSGWKGKKNTAININNMQGKFYKRLLDSYSTTKGAIVYELYCDKKLIASRLCIKNKGMMVTLKTTYDEAYAKYAPGRILLFYMLKHEFDLNELETIEFYTNATSDQISWSTGQRDIEHVTLFSSQLLKNIYLLLSRIRRCFNGK